jgi:AAA+ superfamily predicted ATPase
MLLLHASEIDSKHLFGHLNQFYDMSKPNPYESMTDFFSEVTPHNDFFSMVQDSMNAYTFIFSNLSALFDSSGKTIMKAIQSHWPATNKSAIFYGTHQEVAELLEQYPSLEQYFPAENRLSLEPYTREEMIFLFFEEAKQANLELNPEAVEKVCNLITVAFERGLITHFDKFDLRDYVERSLLPRYQKNNISNLKAGTTAFVELKVLPRDIEDDFFLNQKSHYNEALEELQAMVGLTEIKRNIRALSGQMKFFQERRLLGLRTTTGATYHAILTGNPGTGKTTVAKLLGKIYHSLGLLSKGDVVYVDRRRIIGRYIGETEENMKLILKEAQGNVLFIDEAYTLYTQGDERDFGRHAVECLLDVLSRKDPDMLIIFAGYEKEMDALMSMNPGLLGRFPYKFHFPNYTAEELMQIAQKMLSADQYELTPEASDLMLLTIRNAVSNGSDEFSNARWVEQFVRNGIIPAIANRVTTSPHAIGRLAYQRIEVDDVRTATEKFNDKTLTLKRRNSIGFCA